MAKLPKQRTPKGSSSRTPAPTESDTITDPRFANIQTDPRFRLPSKRDTHVKVDKRFSRMLKDERFTSKAKVDRYGRKLPRDSGRKELERFYQVEEDGLEGDDNEDVERELRRMSKVRKRKEENEREDSSSSSSSDEDTSDEEEEEEVVFGPRDGQAGSIPTGEVSSRLAIVNLDWDNIRAMDLMAVFSSFAPGNGRILKVSIYPSEFGKERMEREEMEGPPREIFGSRPPNGKNIEDRGTQLESEDEEDDDDCEVDEERIKQSLVQEDKGEEFDATKLRKYQLERLRYFYAVLTCSSNPTAEHIYNAIDGTEYLTTANFFDLRFIPDEMDFLDDKPRDECERIPDGYRPNEFVTDALQHSKVSLSWDADDGTRKEAQRRAFGGSRAEIDENDLKAYLGSDSSDEEEMTKESNPRVVVVDATNTHTVSDNNNASEAAPLPSQMDPNADGNLSKKEREKKRMRSLLGLPEESAPRKKTKADDKAPVSDMQITFSAGLSANPSKGGSIFENEPLTEETTVERYVRKERERKARRKEKAKLSRSGVEPAPEDSGGDDGIALGGEEDGQQPQDLGFDDPFFTEPGAEAQAPSNAARKEAKRKKRSEREAAEALSSAQRAELELLIAEDQAPASGSTNKEIQHFSMPTLLKAEKLLKKNKGKKGKLSASAKEALEAKQKDTFKMDVGDERFRAVFERSEFAIDPSSKSYRESEGIRALVEEGRKRRGRGMGNGDDEEVDEVRERGQGDGSNRREKGDAGSTRSERKSKTKKERREAKEDVKILLKSVKAKSKRP